MLNQCQMIMQLYRNLTIQNIIVWKSVVENLFIPLSILVAVYYLISSHPMVMSRGTTTEASIFCDMIMHGKVGCNNIGTGPIMA